MNYNSFKVINWRKRTKHRMIESMGGQCVCCGYNKCNDALHFHHLDPSKKDFNFSGARASPKSWDKIVDELRKCVIVCAICHAEIHAGVREIPDNSARFDEEYADYRKGKIEVTDSCPVCGKPKLLIYKTCSVICSGKKRQKVDWDSIDLEAELKTHSVCSLAKKLGISDVAIHNRLKKTRINNQ